jgi:hypothetical protein
MTTSVPSRTGRSLKRVILCVGQVSRTDHGEINNTVSLDRTILEVPLDRLREAVSSRRMSAAPPEVPVEEQEEGSLHEHAKPKSTDHWLFANQHQPGDPEVEHVETGVEPEYWQQFNRRSPLNHQGEPCNLAVDQSPNPTHEPEMTPERCWTGIETDRCRPEGKKRPQEKTGYQLVLDIVRHARSCPLFEAEM